MIIPSSKYPTKTDTPGATYPNGAARNITAPGDGTGTPLEAAWVNDWFGFQQAAIGEAGIVASGNADTATDSQLLDALKAITKGEVIHASIAGIPNTELQINASTAGLDEVWDDVNTTVGTSASNLLTRVGAMTGGVIEIEGTGALESVGNSEEHTGYMHLTVDFDNMKVKGTAVGVGGSAWTNRAISETILAGSNTYSFIVVAGNYSTGLSTITIDGTTKKITGIPKVQAISSNDHNSMYKITHKA